MRTAIMGAGSLGTVIGAFIAKAGEQIELIDTNVDHVHALNTNGATLKGFTQLTVAVKAITPEQMEGKYDLVLLLTKQTVSGAAMENLLPHLHKSSIICTLQNGIPEEFISAYVGKERVIGGIVGFGATWHSPGVSILTSLPETLEKYAFEIGELDGSITPRLQQVKAILDNVGKCTIVPNLTAIKWSKLLVNATFSGMSAVLGSTFGDVLNNPKAMYCVARIADETIKVAHAEGIRLTEMQGENLDRLELKDGEEISDKMHIFRKVWGPHSNLKASMLQDLEKGQKTEIDYINGVISEKGKVLGIPTPFNDKVVELVKEGEAQTYVPRFEENLERFVILLK
jgi:2-dehydropantoate 2-reductase